MGRAKLTFEKANIRLNRRSPRTRHYQTTQAAVDRSSYSMDAFVLSVTDEMCHGRKFTLENRGEGIL